VPDRVHQVRLPQADAAVDEKRVVRSGRRFGDCPAGGMCELVRGPYDERIERVARREASGLRGNDFLGRVRLRRNGGSGCQVHVVGDERDLTASPVHFDERLLEDDGIVLREPVAEERVGHPDAQRRSAVGDERRRLEPGGVDMLVDLGFDSGQYLIPYSARLVHACACHC
jgi:hypothetical protein